MSTTRCWSEMDVRELINRVRLNPGLYAKNDKTYKDSKKKKKKLAWESIGFSLKPPCSGEEAQRKFKSLRDQFNKELKKVAGTHASGSAGGEKPTTSSWEFYGDMEFLSDHITPRKIHSSMGVSIQVPSEDGSCIPFTFVRPNELSSNSTCTNANDIVVTVPSDNDVTNDPATSSSSSHEMTISSEDTGQDTMSDNASIRSCASSASAIIRGKATRGLVNPTLPKPDNAASRKRKADDAALNALVQTATSVAQVLTERHEEEKKAKKSDNDPITNDLLKSALAFVPEEKKLLCIIDILKLAEIYRTGGGPCIISGTSKTN